MRRPRGYGPLGLVGLLALGACTSTTLIRGPVEGDTRGRGVIGAAGAPPPTSVPGLQEWERTSSLRGTQRWRLRHPAREGQIAGFTTRASALPGVPVDLRVSTVARTYRVTAYRLGWYRGGTGLVVWRSGPLRGHEQPAPRFADLERRTVVAPWRRTSLVDTDGWLPGVYLLKLHTARWEAHVPYVVRSPSVAGRVVLVAPVTTWQAYNDWGGYSLYTGPVGDRRSWAVSFDRPYPAPGSGELLYGVAPVVLMAERARLPLAYLTNLDLHLEHHPLRAARAYVSMGHDEYWTPRMRRAVERARDRGVNLAFLGANTMYWRIRLNGDGSDPARVVVGYRSDSHLDPVVGPRRTGLFRDLPRRRAGEHTLTGMQYECFPVDASYRVVSPGWWGFVGTGVRGGDAFPHLVGVEADRVYPVPATPRPLQVLSHVEYSCGGVSTSAQSVYYSHRSGAGVFNAGTLRWTCALAARCQPHVLGSRTRRFVRQVTVNVLREFARGPSGVRHPAADNLRRFALSSRNVVPAS
ncbi:N,N-dimethylformamidase beta subunit family domain-containing protein [Nocardioides iriomotensis]|uniref:N,N-dimethylformamidase beta subunit-like C-terminal domain-containing protein n=1 Tax=Nocardioides iriomotensis TaxID=715784 RepID=A0A4Q5J3N8_9ACTN|nr:N,N-dimethylformamidase beta subunit family domain-containing protein [Nocardioides iriomotensis]RYU13043.1 hypothetical protein ETU37_08940 [Nocardioides iriomotensis]